MRQFVTLCLLVVALAACSTKANPNADKKDDSIPVKLTSINGQSGYNTVHASGLLSTENESRFSFKIGGVIDNILVTEGQRVSRGQLLATIKPTEIASQVQQVSLGVEKAQRDYQRAMNLYKDSVATLEQLQNAKTGLEIAQQNMRQVSFNQQYAKIYAVNDGFIAKKIANLGEVVTIGSTVIIMNALGGGSSWVLRTGVPDKVWAAVGKGNKATVQFDAFPGKEFKAVVSKKALASDAVSGSFQLEMKVSFNKVQPAVGMFGNASITTTKQTTGYSIPYDALLEANGKKGFVFVSDDQKTVKRVEVTIGTIGENEVYLTSGLEGHQWIITSGSPYLADGVAVKVVK